jgi:hypothetical protein
MGPIRVLMTPSFGATIREPHRSWQTPRTSIIERDWQFSDYLKCTMIYEAFGLCEVYRMDMDL